MTEFSWNELQLNENQLDEFGMAIFADTLLFLLEEEVLNELG